MWKIPNKSREGWVFVDHRASPGLPEDVARRAGYDPAQVKEGKYYETGTLTCAHCKNTFIKNPLRTRERSNCPKCGNHFICDICAFKMTLPDYNHMPFDKRAELALSGKLPADTGYWVGSPPSLLTK